MLHGRKLRRLQPERRTKCPPTYESMLPVFRTQPEQSCSSHFPNHTLDGHFCWPCVKAYSPVEPAISPTVIACTGNVSLAATSSVVLLACLPRRCAQRDAALQDNKAHQHLGSM